MGQAVSKRQWVRPIIIERDKGFTLDAMNKKRQNGVWPEDVIWKKAPDGHVMFDPSAIDDWVEGRI